VLGLGFGLAVIVGSTLGIGILRTPGLIAGQPPTPSAASRGVPSPGAERDRLLADGLSQRTCSQCTWTPLA